MPFAGILQYSICVDWDQCRLISHTNAPFGSAILCCLAIRLLVHKLFDNVLHFMTGGVIVNWIAPEVQVIYFATFCTRQGRPWPNFIHVTHSCIVMLFCLFTELYIVLPLMFNEWPTPWYERKLYNCYGRVINEQRKYCHSNFHN